ncbi:hypothetical protein BJ138DRAFT_1127162 [Hygrophoropsis aurantiaca]|uniref:Uncharacterized protein n=1 Tax=Hygrophoropsis aurantiaca TaxID=72124 RepID=A0ACB8AAJ3_9AGAM|nr:hypothetical protein BJ138DRAFT_1127162 [Hygrophoropsis aurantiaca]
MSTAASPELEEGPVSHLPTKVFKGHTERAAVAYFNNGKRLVSGSYDGTIRIWNVENGKEEWQSTVHGSAVRYIAISPDEKKLGGIHQIALSGDGQRLASAAYNEVRIWDMTLSTRRQLGDPPPVQHTYSVAVAWSPSGESIVAGDGKGNIHMWTVPPLNDNITAQAPVLDANIPPLPSASRPRTHSISSSILSLPAAPFPAPPRSPESNNVTAKETDWEYSDNESFDSVFDLPADGTQPAQRRKRRRRRAAPVASTPPISVVPNQRQAPPVIVSAPRHSPPPNQTPSPPAQTPPAEARAVADAPTSQVGALRRLWRQQRTLPWWTRRKPRKTREEPHAIQPVQSSPAPDASANNIETHTEVAADHTEATGSLRPSRTRTIPRLLSRSKRQPRNTTPRPENIELHPPTSPQRHARNPPSHTRPRRHSQSEVVNVAAGRMDQRVAASSNKWTDTIDWLDYICFCMCCPWNKVVSESVSERQGNRTAVGAGAAGSSGSSSGSSLSSRPVNLHNIF